MTSYHYVDLPLFFEAAWYRLVVLLVFGLWVAVVAWDSKRVRP